MHKRLENFHSLSQHTWYRQLYGRLSKSDLAACEEFLAGQETTSDRAYCEAVLRWGLDQDRPGKYALMNELLLVAGTMAMGAK